MYSVVGIDKKTTSAEVIDREKRQHQMWVIHSPKDASSVKTKLHHQQIMAMRKKVKFC